MHIFVDISDHGLGHLAIVAPVLDRMSARVPALRLTVRSGLREEALRRRIAPPFRHIAAASDFGFRMIDAIRVDLEASAAAYQAAHARWAQRVEEEATMLCRLGPDLVLSSVSALPLAGAARAGIVSAAICSLNWADLFLHFLGDRPWAARVHADLLAGYRSARTFLRPVPSMPMPDLANTFAVAPIARIGRRRDPGAPRGVRTVLVAMGGIGHRLTMERWPRTPGVTWLVPPEWGCTHPDAVEWTRTGLDFTDLLASVDAVLTKPGYGTFTEAACHGTAVLWQRREDWPEQDCLVAWLEANGRALEVDGERLAFAAPTADLDRVLAMRPPARPEPRGADEAAALLCGLIRGRAPPDAG